MRKEKRKTKKDESTLNKQLLKYSLAAGAALGMAQPANAAVICGSLESGSVYSGKSVEIDLDGDGRADFAFYWDTGVGYGGVFAYPWTSIVMDPNSGNSIQFTSLYYQIARLQSGQQVGPYSAAGNRWSSTYGWLNGLYSVYYYGKTFVTGPLSYGEFFDEQGCIGVRFYSEIDDAYHYGWIEYKGAGWSDDPIVAGNVLRWGYETTPERPLPACECEEPAPVPTLNPMGLLILAGLILAAGGAALARRKKKA